MMSSEKSDDNDHQREDKVRDVKRVSPGSKRVNLCPVQPDLELRIEIGEPGASDNRGPRPFEQQKN